MILVLAALLCVASVPLAGGRLSRLVELRVRWGWVALLSLAIQVLITTVAPGGSHGLHVAAHVASYALAGAFVVANRRLPGLAILAAGGALNSLAIMANGGVMPASLRAMRVAGLSPTADFENSAPVAHPHLLALGDVIPVPGPWPLGNVVSVGDLLILAGLAVVLHTACRETNESLELEGPDAVVVLRRVAGVEAVGQPLEDREQAGVRAHEGR